MNNTWQEVSLGEILNFDTGKLDSNAAVENGQFPFFTCSPQTLRIDSYAFDTEAVLLAGNNANGIFPVKYHNGKFNAYQRTYVVTPNDKKLVYIKYAYFLILHLTHRLTQHSIGTATRFLTKDILNRLTVPLPPLPRQHRIASILGALDDKIECNRRINQTLEQMAQALYKHWFVDFAPFRGEGILPDTWELMPFSEIIEFAKGGDWGEEKQTETETESVGIIRGTDFETVVTGMVGVVPNRFISSNSLNQRRLKDGDLILENSVNATSRSTGRTILVTRGMLERLGENVICASFCKMIRLRNTRLAPLIQMHMEMLYRSGKIDKYQNVSSNGIGNFQMNRFLEMEKIPLPRDLNSMSIVLEQFTDLKSGKFTDENNSLSRTRDYLLPKLMSGEIEIKSVDQT